MSQKIRISPVTRINGFWNLEVMVDGGQVTDAWSSGLFFRGFEEILKGRDPRDAAYLTERICGICSTVHAIASSKAIERALDIEIPRNAVLLRNLTYGADLLQNNVRHFYLLSVFDFAQGPDIPLLAPSYKAEYRLTDAENKRILESYKQSFEIARLTHEMVTVFGGKAPHQHGIIPGGFTTPPTTDKIQKFMGMLDLVSAFINDKLIPDVELIAKRYEDYYQIGVGHKNLFCYGGFADINKRGSYKIPYGVYSEGEITKFDSRKIREHVHQSWYKDVDPQHPRTDMKVPAPDPDKKEAYSWVKAPRYDGKAFETGALAHLWMLGKYRRGISAMDRYMTKVLEAQLVADWMKQWLLELEIGKPIYQPYSFTDKEVEGVGYTGAMRGALAHWVRFKGKEIAGYQIITPSAWNCSPRDDKEMRGPLEEALIGTPVADPDNPIEIGRVARSFDPCLACAVHLIDANGEALNSKRYIP